MKTKQLLPFLLAILIGNILQSQTPETNNDLSFSCVAPCPVLTSKTFKTPHPRNRTTIGVGEEVELRIKKNKRNKCGAPQWTLNGSGTLVVDSNDPNKAIFTADNQAGNQTITVLLPDPQDNCGQAGCNLTLNLTFNVIEPTGVYFEKLLSYIVPSGPSAGANCGPVLHSLNRPSAGMHAEVYILPDHVNFYNIVTREELATPIISGQYFNAVVAAGGNIPNHPANNPIDNTDKVYSGKGTLANGPPDLIWGAGLCRFIVSPSLAGTLAYDIPWLYAIKKASGMYLQSDFKQFSVVTQSHANNTPNTTSLYFESVKLMVQVQAALTDASTICKLAAPCP